jgi:hypothetical protein
MANAWLIHAAMACRMALRLILTAAVHATVVRMKRAVLLIVIVHLIIV